MVYVDETKANGRRVNNFQWVTSNISIAPISSVFKRIYFVLKTHFSYQSCKCIKLPIKYPKLLLICTSRYTMQQQKALKFFRTTDAARTASDGDISSEVSCLFSRVKLTSENSLYDSTTPYTSDLTFMLQRASIRTRKGGMILSMFCCIQLDSISLFLKYMNERRQLLHFMVYSQ